MQDALMVSPSLVERLADHESFVSGNVFCTFTSNDSTLSGQLLSLERIDRVGLKAFTVTVLLDLSMLQDALVITEFTHVSVSMDELSLISWDIPSDWTQRREIKPGIGGTVVVLSVSRDDM